MAPTAVQDVSARSAHCLSAAQEQARTWGLRGSGTQLITCSYACKPYQRRHEMLVAGCFSATATSAAATPKATAGATDAPPTAGTMNANVHASVH